MNERIKFVHEWERRFEVAKGRRIDVAELCRLFGVSRQTGYVWIKRFRDAGHDFRAMEDRPRRPHAHPHAVSAAMEELIVAARKRYPKWGPRTLRRWLVDHHPYKDIPSHGTISKILRQRGLVEPRPKRRRRHWPAQVVAPFPDCKAPNHTWCIDFKGWFRTQDGSKCYPLTLLDAYSRLLLRCEALTDPNGVEVERILCSAFREFGLPSAIRSDGGPPFASTGASCLSPLMVWLLRLGITIEIIAPGSPQQNGRLERFHRTLKRDVPPAASNKEQQRAFDLYRAEYNFVRPHHALSLDTPGSVYRRSKRSFPCRLLGSELALFPGHIELVDRHGFIHWYRKRIFISSALAFEHVILCPVDGTRWLVSFGSIEVCTFDADHPENSVAYRRRPKGSLRLSYLGDV